MKKWICGALALLCLLCFAQAESIDLKAWAVSGLTEVLGYTAEEAASFVFEAQPDGSLRYWPPEHPDWVYTQYVNEDGAVRGDTPFDTGYVYRTSEGIFRELLSAVEQKGWLDHWNDGARDALLALCKEQGVRHLSTALRFADTAAQAVDGLLESCFGPRVRWTEALFSLRDSLLSAHGLSAAEQSFHVPGVRRHTGPYQGSAAPITLILFEGETPEELQAAFSDPHLSGWTLTSGAVQINSWKDRGASGAGLAAFEKDGRRQLIQLALMDGGWQIFPLGEKALRQEGDYRVTFNDPGGFTVDYLLDADETLAFYLRPNTWKDDNFVQAFCMINAGHRINRRTGDAQWLGLDSGSFPLWEDQWQAPYFLCTTVRFLPFLGLADIADFPLTLEAGQTSCLPENTGMSLGGVNFRSKTSSHSSAYGQLLSGVVLPVLDVQPGDPWPWVHTRLGAYEGYVAKTYVDLADEELKALAPQPVAKAKKEISLKKGTGLLDGTVQTLAAGTKMHVVMEDGNWLYVSVPRGEMEELMDVNGAFGYVKKSDVAMASLPCQLDWME